MELYERKCRDRVYSGESVKHFAFALLAFLCLVPILWATPQLNTSGVLFVQEGTSTRFSCQITAVTVMTQCQAAPAAGLRNYVTSVTLSNQAATVQTLDVVFGTGANCATAPTALTHKVQFGTLATTTNYQFAHMSLTTPLVPTAANAICIRPSAATAFGGTITGFQAP